MLNSFWQMNTKTNDYNSLKNCAFHSIILVFYNLNSIKFTRNKYIIYEDTLFSELHDQNTQIDFQICVYSYETWL